MSNHHLINYGKGGLHYQIIDTLLILVPRVQHQLGSEPHQDLTLWNHRLGKSCQDVTKEHV